MGYGIMPYRIDLGYIKTCYGVNDDDVKKELIQKTSYELERIDDNLEVEDGWEKAVDILTEFLDGKASEAYNGAKHWYILESLIKILGFTCNNSYWYPIGIDPLFNLNEFKMYTIDSENKISLPASDDFPVVFTVERNNFNTALHSIRNSDFEEDQILQFISWIDLAKEKNQDLVLFYY
ncbi:hypothetical protein [Flammeovirga sp. SJP92]|uniref:DUF7691 family protein n=1 Tax=Flammeovirga sp. SJP92 TaxID=1775430 RepID=UPI000786F73B|nr:hypothetical protein [Flammeovirga sp. SJP92]KXX67564.1 hypothetical protein AVL50_26240 [Flammeovirga sp. SJP92]